MQTVVKEIEISNFRVLYLFYILYSFCSVFLQDKFFFSLKLSVIEIVWLC